LRLRATIALVGLLFAFNGSAQQYGNEWVDYDLQYLKFQVTQTGIYRIDSASLAEGLSTIGVSLASLDPREMQLFGRSQELFIHIEGESDGVFDGGDYIEFYGQGTDGWLDATVWTDPADHNNPYYSLYNDTATYYFTWDVGSAGSNLRMAQETDVSFGNYATVPYVWRKNHIEYHQGFFQGQKQGDVTTPLFTRGEGWWSSPKNNTQVSSVSTRSAYTAGGAPDAKVRAVSASINDPQKDATTGYNHHMQVTYDDGGIVIPYDTGFASYDIMDFSFPMPATALGATTTPITHRFFQTYTTAGSYHAVGYVDIDYPHTLDMENLSVIDFQVQHNTSEAKSYLNLTGFSGAQPMLYDLTDTVKRIPLVANGGDWDAIVPNKTGENMNCYLVDDGSVISIAGSEFKPCGTNGQFTDYMANDLDAAYLIIAPKVLWSSAQQYANYRSIGYDVLLAEAEELYDQYGGGISKHPFALRRFTDEAYHTFSTKPGNLLLLGKAIRPHGEWTNTGSRSLPAVYERHLMPSMGNPLSDILITAGFDGLQLEPAIPTGRISAHDNGDVLNYLNKVMAHESAVYVDWMKHIIHFGGGATAIEQDAFANFLLQYEHIIEDTFFGGQVHTFLKTSSAPIQINLSDSVRNLIDNGVSLITFFGHASGTGFDQSIDIPANYNNTGRYPVLIGNSCLTGDLFDPDVISTSEEWVLIPDKGVIGFLASTKLGIPGDLHRYSLNLYRELGVYSYNGTIGECIKKAIGRVQSPGDFGLDNVVLSMNLHGDPAVKIHVDTLPDYQVDNTSIFFTPAEVTASVDSFEVNVVLKNLGKALNDTFAIYITRDLPTGQDTTYVLLHSSLYYVDTVSLKLPVDLLNGNGLNHFEVSVDLPSFVTETIEVFNNSAEADLLIITGGILPVWPYEYAIIPDSVVTLKASTGDPFATIRTYNFEIDITDEFNSPQLLTGAVTSAGGVIQWDPKDLQGNRLIFTDSTVYFWRVTDDTIWRESSFQYINNKEGWGQAHYYQFKKDSYNLVDYDRPELDFDFVPTSKELFCQTYGDASSNSEYGGTLWKLDLDWENNGCQPAPALHVAIIDPVTLEPWSTYGQVSANDATLLNHNHQFGNNNNFGDYPQYGCRDRAERYFGFWQNCCGMIDTLDYFLNNVVPDSFYILVYTFRYSAYTYWAGSNLSNTFQNLGATQIGTGQDSVPFIFFCQKGNPGAAQEVYGTAIDDVLTFSKTLNADYSFGTITSEVAGPAEKWDALYWEQHPVSGEFAGNDSTSIEVIGIRANGTQEVVATFHESVDSVVDLYNYVDAAEFPFLKLRAHVQDDSTATPAQLERWQLLYQPMPEAALNPNLGYSLSADSVQEGAEIQLAIAIENISDYDMDSLLVHYWVEDMDRNKTYLPYVRQDSLRVGEVLRDTITFSTTNFVGVNYLWVEANPMVQATNDYDQLEQHHFNNLAYIRFEVDEDKINPLLDVTFDGIHIMDGEIVSAYPNIMITLDDENPFLLMDELEDTAQFKVFIYDPVGAETRVYFDDGGVDPVMEFIPAGSDNKCIINYNPRLILDGEYRLLVQANDKSRNASGDFDFEINFEVINRLTVTEVMNYPNPFSTSTRFVFTITGVEPPPYFMIQIMTVSGRVVREIRQDELGDLRIGRNITDYAWDGRDNFGDQLANGVYLYRVIVKDNYNSDVELRETDASQWFKKGFGKMYLMR
jgi:hypothetical protein